MEDAETLLEMVADYNMEMALPKDIPTLRAQRTKNMTRPDNVFCSSNTSKSIIRCDTMPSLQGPCTDHFPIATVIDIPTQKEIEEPTHNFRMVDWEDFNEKLEIRLDKLPKPGPIPSNEIFQKRVEDLTKAIQQTIQEAVPMTRPSPHMKRWWSKELEDTQ